MLCTFCDRKTHEVELMVQGFGGVAICSECIETAWELLQRKRATSAEKTHVATNSPPSSERT